jgi:hypothetical protein
MTAFADGMRPLHPAREEGPPRDPRFVLRWMRAAGKVSLQNAAPSVRARTIFLVGTAGRNAPRPALADNRNIQIS